MKKKITNALLAIMLVAPLAVVGVNGNVAVASTATQQKIMWGSNELSPTQIGRIVFLKNTKLYKRDVKNVPSFHLNAKKGSMWRVHKITNEGGKNIYDLGGGVRVQQSELSTIEYVPKELVAQQVKQYGAKIEMTSEHEYNMDYPQVTGLANKDAEIKINSVISAEANFHEMEKGKYIGNYDFYYQVEYKVVENQNNRLKILIDSKLINTLATNGDNAVYNHNTYTLLFDITTGMQIK